MNVSNLGRITVQPTRSSDSRLEIINETESSRNRGTKRYTDVFGPQPPKKKKSQTSIIDGFFGLFRGWFRVTEEQEDYEDMDQPISPSSILNTPRARRSASTSSNDILCEGIVERPEVICTSSRKTINALVPKHGSEPEESQEEVEIVAEVHNSPVNLLRLSQNFIEEAIKSVENADSVQIEEQESSSDSFSILSDNLNDIKGQSPGPEDSVSRQNTPSRFQSEDFQTPRDSWSRRPRHRSHFSARSGADIPKSGSTPLSKSRLKKFTNQRRTPLSAYRTPTGNAGLLAYDNLLKRSVRRHVAGTSPMLTNFMETKSIKPYDYLIRAKAAMRKHKSRQASECIPSEDGSNSTTSCAEIAENSQRSRTHSETPSISSYHSTGREKVDDLIATLKKVDLTTENVLSNYDKYKHDKKFRVHKELELKETTKQINEIRDLHAADLAEDVRQKLYLTGIRPPLPKKKEKDEFPELPPEALIICQRAWGGGPSDEVFCEGFDTKITRKDLATLKPCKWLNDEVITFFLNLICNRSKIDESLPKVYTFNTFFFVNISTKGYNSVRRWTRKVDIFSFDILLVPVHVSGVHWCMAVVDFGKKSIEYFDPMHHSDNGALSFIQQYLKDESKDKRKKDFDFTGWSFKERLDCPGQQNGHDCGVFSTHFAEYCARRAQLTFSQQHMDYFRKRMVYEIVTNKLM